MLDAGVTFCNMGMWSRALRHARRAESILAAAYGRPSTQQLRSANTVGRVLSELGQLTEAEVILRRTAAVAELVPDLPPEVKADILSNLAWTLAGLGKEDEAAPIARKSLSASELEGQPDSRRNAYLEAFLANWSNRKDRGAEAEAYALKALQSSSPFAQSMGSVRVKCMSILSESAQQRGDYDEALRLSRQAVEETARISPSKPDLYADALFRLYWALALAGRDDEATAILQTRLAVLKEAQEESPTDSRQAILRLAEAMSQVGPGQPGKKTEDVRVALEAYSTSGPKSHAAMISQTFAFGSAVRQTRRGVLGALEAAKAAFDLDHLVLSSDASLGSGTQTLAKLSELCNRSIRELGDQAEAYRITRESAGFSPSASVRMREGMKRKLRLAEHLELYEALGEASDSRMEFLRFLRENPAFWRLDRTGEIIQSDGSPPEFGDKLVLLALKGDEAVERVEAALNDLGSTQALAQADDATTGT